MTKKFGLQSLPAKFEVPAFGLIRKAPPSVTGFMIACRMLEKIGPTTKSTLSRSTKRLDLGDRDVGLQLVVLDDHLDLAAAELAAELLDGELEAVAELLAEHRGRARQRGDHADLELLLRLRCADARTASVAAAASVRNSLCMAGSPWRREGSRFAVSAVCR